MAFLLLSLALIAGCASVATISPQSLIDVVWIDHEHRVIWTRTSEDAWRLLCLRWRIEEFACGALAPRIRGAYFDSDDVIVLSVDADDGVIDHEWCHRWVRWRHEVGNSYPAIYRGRWGLVTQDSRWPAVCDGRPWREVGAIRRPKGPPM